MSSHEKEEKHYCSVLECEDSEHPNPLRALAGAEGCERLHHPRQGSETSKLDEEEN